MQIRVAPRAVASALVFTLALGEFAQARAADQALIAEARSTLYTHRDRSIALLEQAVQNHPDDVAYWVEYIHALSVNSDDFFADLASRHALTLHPQQPDLLIARAQLHPDDGMGLEALAKLAKVPGHKEQAAMLTDLVTCELALPESDPWPAATYMILADRLLILDRRKDAERYLDEAIKIATGQALHQLVARRAILAVLDGDYDHAMKLNRAAGGLQVHMEGSYYGVADALLAKGKPDLAVASFTDPKQAKGQFLRVLAMAKARTNDFVGALKLLNGNALEDRLLRCRVLLDAKRIADAKALGKEIVAPMKLYQGSYAGPWIGTVFHGPRSLVDDYLFVTRWLNERFAENHRGIAFVLGLGTEKPLPLPQSQGWSPVEPLSQTIDRLEAKLKASAPPEQESLRVALAGAYYQAGRLADATRLLAMPPPKPLLLDWKGIIDRTWVRWSLLRRDVEAQTASEKDYARLAAARPIIDEIRNECFQSNGQPLKNQDAAVKKLIAIGPPVLAEVIRQLGPNTISGQDRCPWISVIESLGSAQDAPVLISTLALVAGPQHHSWQQQNENDRLTAAALEACLQKLTSANPPGENRAVAWSKWWQQNAAQIVIAKSPG